MHRNRDFFFFLFSYITNGSSCTIFLFSSSNCAPLLQLRNNKRFARACLCVYQYPNYFFLCSANLRKKIPLLRWRILPVAEPHRFFFSSLPSFLIFLFLIFIIFLFVSVSCGCNNKKKFHHLLKHKRFQTVFFSVCCVCSSPSVYLCVIPSGVCVCVARMW